MKKIEQQNFIVSAGLIRVLAILGVVSLHVTDAIINPTNYLGGNSWWMSNIVNSLGRVSVPLFIMLSGYLILSKEKNFQKATMVKRAIVRIGIPLAFWTVFYFIWRHIWLGESLSFSYISKKIFSENIFHLYFLVIIAGLYLTTPYLKKFYFGKSKKIQKKILIVIFTFSVLLTFLNYKIFSFKYIYNIFTFFIFFIGYYLAGDYLRKIKLNKLQILVVSISTISLLLITSYLNYLNRALFISGNKLFWNSTGGQYFSDYLSPNIILMSLLIFILLINLEYKKFVKNKLLTNLTIYFSATAFGVYLIHPWIIDLLDHFANMAIHLINSNLWFYIIKKIVLVYLISHFIVYLLRKTFAKIIV